MDRHREQVEKMQEKLLNMQIEEDKLEEEVKAIKDAPPSQSSSHPGTPVAVSVGATPPDASMEDLLRTSHL